MNRCLLCGAPAATFSGLCISCRKIELSTIPRCSRCGQFISVPGGICGVSCPIDENLDSAVSLFPYSGDIPELISLWKFRDNRILSRFFAEKILAETDLFSSEYFLVPVPASKEKLKRKGWDQVSDLCHYIRRKSGREICNCLEKTLSLSIKQLGKDERLSGVKLLYRLIGKPPEKVLLIDDVLTTGATLRECARLLKSGGAAECHSITLCRD